MSRTSAFDSADEESFKEGRIRPLFTLENLDDEETVLQWVNDTYMTELKRILPYREQSLRHIALYKNKWYSADNNQSSGNRSGFAEASTVGLGITPTRPSKLTTNHLFDLVNQRVAKVLRTPAGVEIAPANAEYRDRISAKVVGMWIKYLFYKNDFDVIRAKVSKGAFTMGESYIWVRWNPNLGAVHGEWTSEETKARAEGRPPRLPLRDDKGEPVTGQDGEQIWIERPLKTGEVELVYCSPLNTIAQFTGDFDKAEYFFHEEFQDVDELRALYPDQADKIVADSTDSDDALAKWRNMSGTLNGPQQGKVLVRYFRHKPTDFLASGRWIVSTRTALLVNKKLQPHEEGLHLIRLTDIDNPDEQRGQSFFIQGKQLNAAINDLTSMSMRNQKMLAHPKWILPKGSVVKKDALGNDITMVEFSGPIAPSIQTPPPMNGENMAVKGDLKNDLQQILGSSGSDRGQIPANIRSATALQALQEQDDMRSSAQNLKQASFVRDVVEAAINLASSYYEKDDKRLIPVVGRDNRYLLKEFDPEQLTRGYDVRVMNDNGLPTSKAVRFDMAMQLRETMPNYMTEERLADFMQWGDSTKILDAATLAQRAAEAENEAMLSMDEVSEPASYENCIVHWTTHVKEVQDHGFKLDVPPTIQNRMIGHIMATEMLMMEAALRNPRYAVELVKIAQWPMFYCPSAQEFMVLDAARTGNPLTLQQVQALLDPLLTQPTPPLPAGQTPGAGPQGGVNPETNGIQGMGGNNPVKADVMAGGSPNIQEQAPEQGTQPPA